MKICGINDEQGSILCRYLIKKRVIIPTQNQETFSPSALYIFNVTKLIANLLFQSQSEHQKTPPRSPKIDEKDEKKAIEIVKEIFSQITDPKTGMLKMKSFTEDNMSLFLEYMSHPTLGVTQQKVKKRGSLNSLLQGKLAFDRLDAFDWFQKYGLNATQSFEIFQYLLQKRLIYCLGKTNFYSFQVFYFFERLTNQSRELLPLCYSSIIKEGVIFTREKKSISTTIWKERFLVAYKTGFSIFSVSGRMILCKVFRYGEKLEVYKYDPEADKKKGSFNMIRLIYGSEELIFSVGDSTKDRDDWITTFQLFSYEYYGEALNKT